MRSLESFRPGTTLGRYELLAPIARGGMATVWAARLSGTRGFSKTVAVKTILPALMDDLRFEQMFLDEATLASRIRHPNVAQILDLGEQDEVLYLVMEWVDGEPISVALRAALRATGRPIPVPFAARLVLQAAAGLHAAHELRDEEGNPLGLVHRDVSPQNVLVTYEGVVKIVDFGVAKALGRGSADTGSGQLKGKVAFMSPEQARAEDVDRRSDVFSLGAMLYQLVTGHHPFRGEHELATLQNVVSLDPIAPRKHDPSLPAAVEAVILRALSKARDDRFATMADFSAALERATAPLASDDEVRAWVTATFGNLAPLRHDALRSAMREADELRASLTPPPGHVTQSGAPGPVVPASRASLSLPIPLLHEREAETLPNASATPRAATRRPLGWLVVAAVAALLVIVVSVVARSRRPSGEPATASPAPSAPDLAAAPAPVPTGPRAQSIDDLALVQRRAAAVMAGAVAVASAAASASAAPAASADVPDLELPAEPPPTAAAASPAAAPATAAAPPRQRKTKPEVMTPGF